MITIYGKSYCPYTRKVIDALDNLGLSYTKLNVADPKISEEVIAKGGKHQTPYLVDGEIALYESEDIIAYLNGTYGEQKKETLHIHKSDGLCSSCNAVGG